MKLFFGEIFPNVLINEEEQNHIQKVLRMRENDEIFLTDGKGNLAKGNLLFEGKKVKLSVTEIQENLPNFSKKLHIAIAPTKNIDRTEFFVEKAIELGVSEITFLLTDHSERKNIKLDRIYKQAITAAKQSLRVYFPKINDVVKLDDFMLEINPEKTFLAHCNKNFERISLKNMENKGDLVFLIGPEGDFSEREIKKLQEKRIQAVSLGNQRLRTETAGIFISAWNYNSMIT